MIRYSVDNHYVNASAQKKQKKNEANLKKLKYGPAPFSTNYLLALDLEPAPVINASFLNGSLLKSLKYGTPNYLKNEYLEQSLGALEWAFNSQLVREEIMTSFLAASIGDMELAIDDALKKGIMTHEEMRETDRLNLDIVPFSFTKKRQIPIQELPRDDDRRLAFQALFLFLLRPRIHVKYPDMESFLEQYPSMEECSANEREKLRLNANWMNLAFYCINPRNNKTFIMNLIPRIVEGRTVRYVTGSGQTRQTADRVTIFRHEGNCLKIKRPPRKKPEESANSTKYVYSTSALKASNAIALANTMLPAPSSSSVSAYSNNNSDNVHEILGNTDLPTYFYHNPLLHPMTSSYPLTSAYQPSLILQNPVSISVSPLESNLYWPGGQLVPSLPSAGVIPSLSNLSPHLSPIYESFPAVNSVDILPSLASQCSSSNIANDIEAYQHATIQFPSSSHEPLTKESGRDRKRRKQETSNEKNYVNALTILSEIAGRELANK